MDTVAEALREFENCLPAYEAGASATSLPPILPDLVITGLDEASLPFPRIRPINPFAEPDLWQRFVERAYFKIKPDNPKLLHPTTVYRDLWHRFERIDPGLFAHVGQMSMELDTMVGRVEINFDGYFRCHRITITLLEPNFTDQTFDQTPCGYSRCRLCRPVFETVKELFPSATMVNGRIRCYEVLNDDSALWLYEALGGLKAQWYFCVWCRGLAEPE